VHEESSCGKLDVEPEPHIVSRLDDAHDAGEETGSAGAPFSAQPAKSLLGRLRLVRCGTERRFKEIVDISCAARARQQAACEHRGRR